MATLQQKLNTLTQMSGFDGYNYEIYPSKVKGVTLAVVEYWLAVGNTENTTSNLKIFVIKGFGTPQEVAKETTSIPKTLSIGLIGA